MMNKMFGRLTVLSLVLCAAANAPAEDEPDGGNELNKHHRNDMRHQRMGDPTRMLEMMTRHLELDTTQSQQLSNILETAKPEIEDLRNGLRENREAMHSLATDDPDYGVKLQNLAAHNAELATQMTMLHGTLRAEVHALLTPEQQEMLAERADRKGSHRRSHRPDAPTQ